MKFESLRKAIQEAEENGVIVSSEHLTGFSGNKLIGTLQRFCQLLNPQEHVYVEIGVFQGLSLLSMGLANTELSCFGIDNFSQFDKDNQNQNIINDRIKKTGLKNIDLINSDYEVAGEILKNKLGDKKIGVFFIDGPHDYRSQLMCFLLYLPYLADDAIIIVDDSNYLHVRQANKDFLVSQPEYKLIFEAYTKSHPHAMNAEDYSLAKKGYWDGVNIIVRDKNNELTPMYPPIYEDKTLFYNEHAVQSSKFADCAPQAVKISRCLKPFNPVKLTTTLFKLFVQVRKADKRYKGKDKYINTFSDELNTFNLNQSL